MVFHDTNLLHDLHAGHESNSPDAAAGHLVTHRPRKSPRVFYSSTIFTSLKYPKKLHLTIDQISILS